MSKDFIKVSLLIIIFASTMIIPFFGPTETSKTTTNNYQRGLDPWEYVKDRLFDGETLNVKKFHGPILIDLQTATPEDSTAVKKAMKKVKSILPHKEVDFLSNYIDKNNPSEFELAILNEKSVKFRFNQFSDEERNNRVITGAYTKLLDGNMVLSTKHIKMRKPFYFENNLRLMTNFLFNRDISNNRREQIVTSELIGGLCFIEGLNVKAFSYNQADVTIKEISPGKVEAYIDGNENHSSIFNYPKSYLNNFISKYDIFLLQKLYADDFIAQFKSYMFENYSWRYAMNFTNKKLMKNVALSIIVSLFIIIFTLSFRLLSNRKFKYSYLNYLFPSVILLLTYVNLPIVYNHLTEINVKYWWNSYVGGYTNIIHLMFITVVLWLLDTYFIKDSFRFSTKLLLKTLYTFFGIMIPWYIVESIKFSFPHFSDIPLDFWMIILAAFIITLTRVAILYSNHLSESMLKEKNLELSHLRELYAKAELKSIHAHINPHFLYNALNSIASLAPIDTVRTQKMAYSLSDLFKYSINREGKKMNTIHDEVTMVESYLEIEKIRFGERLQYSIDVEKELEKYQIPLFIIQPLVENAVKHGISKIESTGKIALKIERENNSVQITITDNGPDFPEGLVSGHGLQTVYDLLKLSYGENASLNWVNKPEKVITVCITQI